MVIDIKEKCGRKVSDYIAGFVPPQQEESLIVHAVLIDILESSALGGVNNVINTHRINDIRRINKFFNAVNAKISTGGIFIGCAEINQARNLRLLKRYPKFLAYTIIFFNFFFLRVFPKIRGFKQLYYFMTKGRGRALSKAEVLGRLVSCGFEIVDYREIENLLWFVTRKDREPYYDLNPSYTPIYKMKRVGKHGKIIQVYKFRTMHPYSEYLQAYLAKNHGYNEVGKIEDDFRMTKYGRFLRRYWLDELPQLINVLKGEMKLVGVRPLSQARFNEFPDDMKQKRIKYKPGCFPPYVALLMPDMVSNIEAERIYLHDKEKNPYTTDIKYLLKSIYNILAAKIRSG